VEKVNFKDEVVLLECPNCGLKLRIEYSNRRALYFKGIVKKEEEEAESYEKLGEPTEKYVTKCPFCNKEYRVSSESKKEEIICSCGSKGKVNFDKKKVEWIKR